MSTVNRLSPGLALGAAIAGLLAPAAAHAAPATLVKVTVSTATALPTTSISYEEESLEAFEAQLRAGQIRRAEFNRVAHHLHLVLANGRYMLVDYPGHEQHGLQARILAAGVPVTIEYTPAAKAKPVHHTLRYVAAALLVVVLILLAVLLILRRRRLTRLEEEEEDAPAAPSPQSRE
jgi:Flp pilus assembly protein TadB